MTEPSGSLLPIGEIAAKLGLADEDLEPYGRFAAKIKLHRLPAPGSSPRGKLILVTAMTPTSHGEGKTVVSIGLTQALEKLGKRSVVTLREPSLGPVFGIKGGATGGGRSQVLPSEKINLHFNGDKHAVTAAHNLLAALIDSHLYHGNELRISPESIAWPRTVDMNDRALRRVTLAGGSKGSPRESAFVITAASEVMAILALASSRADCARRLGDIAIGFNDAGEAIRASELQAGGAMMALLNEAVMPNLVQTTEHTPALIHAGPFANIAHGTSSVISQRMGLALADYVVNEAGFGADLGAEKFFDIVMPASSLKPSAAALVVTARAVRHHSKDGFQEGLENLARHIEICRKFRVPTVVAVNRFLEDPDQDLRAIVDFCGRRGVECAVVQAYDKGGEGALELAGKIIAAAETADPEAIEPLYAADLAIEDKVARVAEEIYGATGVEYAAAARAKIEKFSALGFAKLPVCVAKTQYSLSDNPKALGAPKNWALKVTEAHLASGAGFIVLVAGNMTLMPGLPKIPQAARITVDDYGRIHGLG
ncbi:MAG TPA: formate--tetrahydrofolate ligase [Candidatus Acidoferrales bacterium]|nr:formate--tetrahydrofolate ligase [Candidatus Acidoferrales bacterium]